MNKEIMVTESMLVVVNLADKQQSYFLVYRTRTDCKWDRYNSRFEKVESGEGQLPGRERPFRELFWKEIAEILHLEDGYKFFESVSVDGTNAEVILKNFARSKISGQACHFFGRTRDDILEKAAQVLSKDRTDFSAAEIAAISEEVNKCAEEIPDLYNSLFRKAVFKAEGLMV